jgi:hypothetical protein
MRDQAVVECGDSVKFELIMASRITPSDADNDTRHPRVFTCLFSHSMKMHEKAHEDQHSPIFLLAERGMAVTKRRRERQGIPRSGRALIWLIRCKGVAG